MGVSPLHCDIPRVHRYPYTCTRVCRLGWARSIARRHGVVIEIHVTVRLGPQANAPRYRLRQHVLEVELAVEISLDFGARDPHLEIVPLPCRRWSISVPFH